MFYLFISSFQGFTKISSYLSPGATRSNGAVNPNYTSTFVFPNDFAALVPGHTGKCAPPGTCKAAEDKDELFQSREAAGECHVMCFTPHSDLSLPLMSEEDIQTVIREWMRLSDQLKHNLYVQVKKILKYFYRPKKILSIKKYFYSF